MSQLIKQKQRLKTVVAAHTWVFPGIGSIVTSLAAGVNKEWFLIGFLLLLYNFSIGFFVIAAKANRALSQIVEEEKKVSDRQTRNRTIHEMLDSRRDQLIFDGNQEYWTILEKLET